MKFIIHKSKDKQFYFTVHSKNGYVVATSETYKTKGGAKKGIASIILNSVTATIVDNSK